MSKIIIADGLTSEILDHIHKYDVIDNNHERDMSNWLEVFDFTAFANKRYAQHLVDRNRLIIPDEDGTYRELVIKKTDRYSDKNGVKFIDVISLGFYQDLDGAKIIESGTTAAQSPEAHMRDILAGTEVRVGEVAYTGNIRTITRENYTDPFSALKSLANEFDLELNFRIEVDRGKIVRYADLVERIGEWSGRTIEFGQDLQTISRKTDANNIVTALRVLGPEREEGERLEVIVEDEDARNRWGRDGEHIIKTYEPQSEDQDMTMERLTQLGRTELNKRINALVTWEASVTDLEHVPGMQNKKIRYGDSIRIKDTYFNPPFFVEARIFKQRRNIFNPGSKEVELGDFREYTIEEVRQNWQSIKEELEKKIKWAEIRAGFGDIKFTIISYKSPLKTAKAGYDSQYNSLYDNPDLEASIRGTLSYAKSNYDAAYNALVNTIDVKADLETLSDADLAEVNALYADYEKELAVLKTNFELATDAIGQTKSDRTEDKANDYTDQRMIDINLELDDARKNIDEARKNLDEMNGRLDNAVVDLDEARDNIEDAKDRLADLDTALEDARNQLNDKVDFTDYNAKIREITDDIADKVDGEWVDGRLRVELDKLEYENRNLLLNTSASETDFNFSGYNGPGYRVTEDKVQEIADGGVYTASVEITELNTVNTDLALMVSLRDRLSNARWQSASSIRFTSNQTGRIVFTLEIPPVSDVSYIEVHLRNVSPSGSSSGKFKEMQLEKGTRATPYSQAPEDIFSDINKKADVNNVYVKADIDGMFDNTVSLQAYETDQEGYVERFKDYETNIEQTWEEINARLKSTDYDEDMGKLDSRLATWEATAEGFEQTVSEVRSDLDNLEIGGRNLLRGTSDTYRDIRVSQWNGTVKNRTHFSDYGLSHGDVVTFSVDIKAINKPLRARIDFYSEASGNVGKTTFLANSTIIPIGNEGRSSVTVTLDEAKPYITLFIQNADTTNLTSTTTEQCKAEQLEKGNRATDWSPAPEDSISYTETRVKQLSDEWSTTYIKNDEVIAGIRIGDSERIGGANVEITGDTAIYGELTAPDAVFKKITVDEAYIVNSEIENMTITGTQNTENAIFQRGEFRKVFIDEAEIDKATILDSDLENVRITGEMTAGEIRGVDIYGGSISSGTSIDVTTDLKVGNNVFIGTTDQNVATKSIIFYSTSANNVHTGISAGYSGSLFPAYSLKLTARNKLLIDSPEIDFSGGNVINFESGSSIDNTEGIARWRQSNSNYIRQDADGSVYLYQNGSVRFSLTERESYKHGFIRSGNVGLKFTNESSTLMQARNYADTGYADFQARTMYAIEYAPSSTVDLKQDISEWDVDVLDIYRNDITIYDYLLNDEVERGIYKRRQGLVIGGNYNTPEELIEDGRGISLYKFNSWNAKAIQELINVTDDFGTRFANVEDEISWLKTENQLLKNELKKQKYRIEQLEELVA